jgi:hypothetical protein
MVRGHSVRMTAFLTVVRAAEEALTGRPLPTAAYELRPNAINTAMPAACAGEARAASSQSRTTQTST